MDRKKNRSKPSSRITDILLIGKNEVYKKKIYN